MDGNTFSVASMLIGILLGVLASLAASYLKPWLDKKFSRYSKTLRAVVARRNEKREREIALLNSDMLRQCYYNSSANTHLICALLFFLTGFLVLIMFIVINSSDSAPDSLQSDGIKIFVGFFIAFAFALFGRRLFKALQYLNLLDEVDDS